MAAREYLPQIIKFPKNSLPKRHIHLCFRLFRRAFGTCDVIQMRTQHRTNELHAAEPWKQIQNAMNGTATTKWNQIIIVSILSFSRFLRENERRAEGEPKIAAVNANAFKCFFPAPKTDPKWHTDCGTHICLRLSIPITVMMEITTTRKTNL